MPDEGLIAITLIMLILMVYMLRIDLKTFVDKDGIQISMWFFPFYTKTIFFSWEDISEITVKKYNPILMYGGWGIRRGSLNLSISFGKMRYPARRGFFGGFNNIAYTMYGNKGIQFVYKNKKNVLIGTNRPEELSEVLRKLCKSEGYKE